MSLKTITILISHNKSPYIHDLFTIQCNNVIKKLQLQFNIQIVWVLFPPEKTESMYANPRIINARHYTSTINIIDDIKPNLVLINGSLDFHNVEIALAAKFKKIPLVTFFFRNINTAKLHSTSDTLRTRIRGIFSNKVGVDHVKGRSERFKWFYFYLSQFRTLSKTLKTVNYNLFQQISFVIFYIKIIFTSSVPLHQVIIGDANLCSVPQWIDKLYRCGFTKTSIIVVGNPYFDSLYSEIKGNQSKGISVIDKTKILFCTSTMHQHDYCSKKEEYDLIKNVIQEILNHERFEIVIKIHPSTASKEEFIQEVLKKIPHEVKLYQRENLVDLINQCDVVVSYGGSGAIVYGVLLGKPVVNLQFNTRVTGNNTWIDDKVIIKCDSLNSLASQILESKNMVFSKENYENFIERNIGILDGKSSERAANVIVKLLERK